MEIRTTAIIAALPYEAAKFLDNMSPQIKLVEGHRRILSGKWKGHPLQLAISGVGRHNAIETCSLLISHFRPDLVINIGLAGGTHPDMAEGDVLAITNIKSRYGETLELDMSKLNPVLEHCEVAIKKATLLTSDNLLKTPQEKAFACTTYGVQAVDMEAYHIGAVCKMLGADFLCLKAIFDELSFTIPVTNLLREDGSYNVARLCTLAIKQPLSLLRMAYKKDQAVKNLYQALSDIIGYV